MKTRKYNFNKYLIIFENCGSIGSSVEGGKKTEHALLKFYF